MLNVKKMLKTAQDRKKCKKKLQNVEKGKM